MDEMCPVAETERKFLDHATDLITFCNHRTCIHCDCNTVSRRWVDLGLSLAPLLVYFLFSVMGWFSILVLLPSVVAGFLLRTDAAAFLLGWKDTILAYLLGATLPDGDSKNER